MVTDEELKTVWGMFTDAWKFYKKYADVQVIRSRYRSKNAVTASGHSGASAKLITLSLFIRLSSLRRSFDETQISILTDAFGKDNVKFQEKKVKTEWNKLQDTPAHPPN